MNVTTVQLVALRFYQGKGVPRYFAIFLNFFFYDSKFWGVVLYCGPTYSPVFTVGFRRSSYASFSSPKDQILFQQTLYVRKVLTTV